MSTDSPSANDDYSDASASGVDEAFADDDGVLYDDEVTPEFGVLGFTLRELLIVGAWVVLFVLSFLSLGWSPPLWAQGISWVLPIGVPTVAVFLIVLRRFSPDGIRRVGSLGIDQFASVAFTVAAVWWLQLLWEYVSVVVSSGMGGVVWVPWVQLVVALALVVLTVFAPLVPGIGDDFRGRLVTLAHRNANPVRPVIARPRPEPVPFGAAAPAAAENDPPADATYSAGYTTPAAPTPVADDAATTEQVTSDHPTTAHPLADHAVTDAYQDVELEPTSTPYTRRSSAAEAGLDVELSGEQATDEVARLDLAGQVPLASHVSGGDTGTAQTTSDDDYVPSYSRQSRGQQPEIVSDTGSIESLLGTSAGWHGAEDDAIRDSVDEHADLDATKPREPAPAAQPFWILAQTERDVHDERGDAIFRIGPNAWALVIEDRGGAYVIRHDDGRIGYLHDVTDITRG